MSDTGGACAPIIVRSGSSPPASLLICDSSCGKCYLFLKRDFVCLIFGVSCIHVDICALPSCEVWNAREPVLYAVLHCAWVVATRVLKVGFGLWLYRKEEEASGIPGEFEWYPGEVPSLAHRHLLIDSLERSPSCIEQVKIATAD
jgi:hypothetical protein